jgi:outer membrane protein TolC
MCIRDRFQAARLAFLPALNLSAHVGFNAFASSLWFAPGSIAYSALGGLTAPLLNRKGLKSDRAYKYAEQYEAFHQYNKVVLDAYQEVKTHMQALENLAAMTNFKRREVTALQQAVAISNDLFVGGVASYLEIFTAQKSVLEAEIQLTQIQQKQFQESIRLYRALGGGWE